MKKFIWLGIAGVVALIILGAILVGMHGSKSSKVTTTSQSSSSSDTTKTSFTPVVKNACDILTQTIADSLLGAGSKAGDSTAGDTENDSVKVSQCSFTSGDYKSTVSLLVRAAKDQTQADSDVTQFQGTTNVPGYGDTAYWAADYGQFNILAHNNWYILSFGPLSPTGRTQAQAQQFADAIKTLL